MANFGHSIVKTGKYGPDEWDQQVSDFGYIRQHIPNLGQPLSAMAAATGSSSVRACGLLLHRLSRAFSSNYSFSLLPSRWFVSVLAFFSLSLEFLFASLGQVILLLQDLEIGAVSSTLGSTLVLLLEGYGARPWFVWADALAKLLLERSFFRPFTAFLFIYVSPEHV